MLRTNTAFLQFVEQLFEDKQAGNAIQLKSFTTDAHLIRQGSIISQVYIIREGITKCYIAEDNGKDYIFEFLGTGEITGELEAINKGACLSNITAITPVTVFAIPHDRFMALLRSYPEFNELLLKVLAARIYQTCIRASYQQLYPVEYALLRLLALEASQQTFFSKKDMAAYLGISVRSFNRTLKDLRAKNILDKEGLNIDLSKEQLEQMIKRFEDA